jgi:hypothetical protein
VAFGLPGTWTVVWLSRSRMVPSQSGHSFAGMILVAENQNLSSARHLDKPMIASYR